MGDGRGSCGVGLNRYASEQSRSKVQMTVTRFALQGLCQSLRLTPPTVICPLLRDWPIMYPFRVHGTADDG